MKMTTTWAVLGSLVITLVLGLAIAGVSGVTASAKAQACSTHPVTQSKSTPVPAAPATSRNHAYLIAVRMGWAI
jgi:hypothetical protein